MRIDKIRIYCEVFEQGCDFKDYICKGKNIKPQDVIIVYNKKVRSAIQSNDSIVARIQKSKDYDLLVTAISSEKEYPLFAVEYSTAVPTDDHRMQRADTYYWGQVFKMPIFKICATNKGMDQSFGGGDNITDKFEICSAIKNGSVLYLFLWDNENNILKPNHNRPSCIPYSADIQKRINGILQVFENSTTPNLFYNICFKDYKKQYEKEYNQFLNSSIKDVLKPSTRFIWTDNKLTAKINRFGHAMDPDRGILFFISMALGNDNCKTEFQIERNDIDGKGGYSALFDAISRSNELLDYVRNKSTLTKTDMLHIFKRALNLDNYLRLVEQSPSEYYFNDDDLYNYLMNSPSISIKSLFLLSSEIILTNKNRSKICSIKWNLETIARYKNAFYVNNYEPIKIEPISQSSISEDLITYCTAELYKQLSHEIIGISYPGAQGDRCILVGSGRNVKRIYVDIVTQIEHNGKVAVFLTEAKDDLQKSTKDIEKLNTIMQDDLYKVGLKNLCRKVTNKETIIESIFTSLSGKQKHIQTKLDVDYLFMFNVETSNEKTKVNWQIFVNNRKIIPYIENICSNDKFVGTFELGVIFQTKL